MMIKKINFILSLLKQVVYIPRMIGVFRNRYTYIYTYTCSIGRLFINRIHPKYIFKDKKHIYITRNWMKIISHFRSDLLIINEIFINRCYGNQVKKNSTIIDIWANIWIFDLRVHEVSSGCKIYAFEPDVGNFKRLEQHIYINKLEDSVICCNQGIQ